VLASIGSTDTRWNDNQVESYRNFANKIWNAARFCLLNSEGADMTGKGWAHEKDWTLADRWIRSRFFKTARAVNEAIAGYDFHLAVQALYHFFWDDFCDWYIELTKADVTAPEDTPERRGARSRLLTTLEHSLRLLHPFMPFLTEELWQRLPGVGAKLHHRVYEAADVTPTIMLTDYPRADATKIDERAESEMQAVIELVSRVRNIRTELSVKPGEHLPRLFVGTPDRDMRHVFADNAEQITRLTRASKLFVTDRIEVSSDGGGEIPRASARAALAGGAEVAVPLEGLIDFEQERARIGREREKQEKELQKAEAQLANTQFVERAPAEKVEELRRRAAEVGQRIKALGEMLEALGE
jgi:valyl-tRNA synthetase